MAAHGADFTVAGALAAPYNSVVRVHGLTVTNTTATAAAVIVRDGGSTGRPVVGGPVPAAAAGVPGILDISLRDARVANGGLYVEIDGGAATGTVWVG